MKKRTLRIPPRYTGESSTWLEGLSLRLFNARISVATPMITTSLNALIFPNYWIDVQWWVLRWVFSHILIFIFYLASTLQMQKSRLKSQDDYEDTQPIIPTGPPVNMTGVRRIFFWWYLFYFILTLSCMGLQFVDYCSVVVFVALFLLCNFYEDTISLRCPSKSKSNTWSSAKYFLDPNM